MLLVDERIKNILQLGNKNMLIIKLWGGLGNQMFLYALGKVLKNKGYEVCLDCEIYNFYREKMHTITDGNHVNIYSSIRKLEIVNFNLTLPFINYSDHCVSELKVTLFQKIIGKIYKLKSDFRSKKYLVTEENFSFKKIPPPQSILNRNFIFEGYFQNIHFFHHLYNDLIKDFSLKSPLSNQNEKIKQKIQAEKNSCFLHIRRGDYLDSKNWTFLKLGQSYYVNAIKLLKNKIRNPHIFIFSNDIAWCKEALPKILSDFIDIKNLTFIEGNDEGKAVEEMELMKSCKHAIIANSTFSWWAAYLIQNPNKICIAPTAFSYNPNIEIIQNLIPKTNWYLIDYIWGKSYTAEEFLNENQNTQIFTQ